MRKTIPAHEETYCDVCHRLERYLLVCIACGKEYCLTCRGIIPGCMVAPDVCKKCDERPAVREICERFAPMIKDLVTQRDVEIARLILVTDEPKRKEQGNGDEQSDQRPAGPEEDDR